MHEQDSASQPETPKQTTEWLCDFDELNEETRQLLEGVTYDQLPETVTLDPRIARVYPELR